MPFSQICDLRSRGLMGLTSNRLAIRYVQNYLKQNRSPAVVRGSRPYCLHPKASKRERSFFFTYLHNFRYSVNFRHLPQILWLQIAAKPRQIATWLLLTTYRNLPTPYLMAPLPPYMYRLATIRLTTDRRRTTDGRTDGRHIVP